MFVLLLCTFRWQFLNCLGVLDGKHIRMRKPKNGGSLYYNYKKFHSLVLMALVDADYKFIWYDIGAAGSRHDSGIFKQTELYEFLRSGECGVPPPRCMPGDDRPMPFSIAGDDAFALEEWLMKPFPSMNLTLEERIFNYRLSRARRVVENAFGIMAQRFRCLLFERLQTPENIEVITEACVILHNMMRTSYPPLEDNEVNRELPDGSIVPGEL